MPSEFHPTRTPKYDVLRLLSLFSILMVHAMPVETSTRMEWYFNIITTPVLLSFVGIYFMMSGMFLLERGTERIGAFYKKRLIQIGIPFVVYDFIYYCYNVHTDGVVLSIPGHLAEFFRQVVTAGVPRAGHLWYMYALAAFYLCAPFLARMLKGMTDRELRLFLILMLVLQGLDVAGEITGISISPWAQYVLYTGWVYYFLLGYGLKRLCGKKQVPAAVFLAALGLLWDVASKVFLPWWTPANPHKSPAMVFLCGAIFLVFEHFGDGIPQWIGRAGRWISGYSYSIYLIHFLIIRFFVVPAMDGFLKAHYIAGSFVVTAAGFVLSLGVSVIVDHLVVRPLIYLAGLCRTRG